MVIIGPPVSGKDLIGREQDMENLWDAAEKGSVLLISPRRFGKTSMVTEMQKRPRAGSRVLYVDVEYMTRPEDFVVAVMEKAGMIESRIQKLISSFASTVKGFEVAGAKLQLREHVRKDWKREGDEIFQSLSEGGTEKLVLAIDELPTMILRMTDDVEAARTFLYWLRHVRNSYGVRMVVCGSIGIDAVVRKCAITESINDLRRISVDPLPRGDSIRMIEQLLSQLTIKHDASTAEMIYERIEVGVPFFINILVQSISDTTDRDGEMLDQAAIDKAYRHMIGAAGRGYFAHYFERLGRYYGNEAEIAKAILNMLAVKESDTEELESRCKTAGIETENLRDLMGRLEEDFYVESNKKVWRFHTRILRDLWRERCGL